MISFLCGHCLVGTIIIIVVLAVVSLVFIVSNDTVRAMKSID